MAHVLERPVIDSQTYRRQPDPHASYNPKPHLADPWLPPPDHDWALDPWGWTVNTLCGLVLRDCQPVAGGTDLCGKCARRAAQGRSAAS